MQTFALLLIGFSLFSALLLAFTQIGVCRQGESLFTKLSGVILLFGLSGLQFAHLQFLNGDPSTVHSSFYLSLLFLIAPSFYGFCLQILGNGDGSDNVKKSSLSIHYLPPLVCLALPASIIYPWGLLGAFLIGTGYLLWIAARLYQLKEQRSRFKSELIGLAALFSIAVLVILLAFSMPLIAELWFFTLYSILIGLAIFMVVLVLMSSPRIVETVSEVAKATYVESTLKHIDEAATLHKLEALIIDDKLYEQEDLKLSTLAELLAITTHQLSELVNTRLNKGFSQYIREHRINAAKRLLIDEPSASVLSIGLSVGFTSQSNFYAAFKELTGIPPGKYRKQSR
jgi:AraC-like DNA-binding protein